MTSLSHGDSDSARAVTTTATANNTVLSTIAGTTETWLLGDIVITSEVEANLSSNDAANELTWQRVVSP